MRLPGGFLPIDDQGFITTDVQTPADSSYNRTKAAVEAVERYLAGREGVENVTFLTGYSFLGQGMNTAQAFITLKDWSERGPNDSAAAIVEDINRNMASVRDAEISALLPAATSASASIPRARKASSAALPATSTVCSTRRSAASTMSSACCRRWPRAI